MLEKILKSLKGGIMQRTYILKSHKIHSPFSERQNINVFIFIILIKQGFGLEANHYYKTTTKPRGNCLILDYSFVKYQNKKSNLREVIFLKVQTKCSSYKQYQQSHIMYSEQRHTHTWDVRNSKMGLMREVVAEMHRG